MTSGSPRTALITGISGQDGSYLAELLLARGYRVVGTTRHVAPEAPWRIAHLLDRLTLETLDLRDADAVRELVSRTAPDEVYHLGAASRVDESWRHPTEALIANAGSTANLLDALRHERPSARLAVASSCEIFGRPEEGPQSEQTPLAPASPYGVSKAAAYWLTVNYRESHGLFATSAILYNHESPRRAATFVTRKITRAAARIAAGLEEQLTLGNLEGRRDWGFAGDYADAMWRLLQLDRPRDVVIGTGISHSVREFCERAFALVGLEYQAHVVADSALFRPVDTTALVANARLARETLDWSPTTDFDALVEMMVSADRERVQRGDAM
ncbi:MAG: GDP-mannose 4,6-dehydratase [Gemmatimonadota bacterium]